MHTGILQLDMFFFECRSLKQKRAILKAIIHRLHREYNVAVAEGGKLDLRDESIIICVSISSDRSHLLKVFESMQNLLVHQFPIIRQINSKIEWL